MGGRRTWRWTKRTPMPLGAYILWPERVRRSMFLRGPSAERSRGSFPVTWTASVWKRAPAAWAMAASSGMGWMTPVSLFAYMMLTGLVLGRMAALRAAGVMWAVGGGGGEGGMGGDCVRDSGGESSGG